MKYFIISVLICLSAMLCLGYLPPEMDNLNKSEILIDSISEQEKLKENLKVNLTKEVKNYISNNSKHSDESLIIEISEQIVNKALDNHIDICFILAQGHIETAFGSYGIGKSKKSIFGVYKNYSSYTDCIDFYVNLLCKHYLVNKSEYDLMNNYTSKQGYRYAEDLNYEFKLKRCYNKIKTSTEIFEIQEKYHVA